MNPTPVHERLRAFIRGDQRLCVVKAPPGSGKSYNLLESLESAVADGYRIAIAAQTNNQVDDLCIRFAGRFGSDTIHRFSSAMYEPPESFPPNVDIVRSAKHLTADPSIVISTVAKWCVSDLPHDYDLLFVDEAWQMTWADFVAMRSVAQRYVMIGDPGQIPPTVTIEVDRWEVSPVAPHVPAPEIVLENPDLRALTTIIEMDMCRRLPNDSVMLINNFYDFFFDAFAQPGERFLRPTVLIDPDNRIDSALTLLAEHSTIIYTHPTGDEGVPMETDIELAQVASDIVSRVLELGCEVATAPEEHDRPRSLTPADIGIVSTHNLMNAAIEACLPKHLVGPDGIRVTTPERWQGLERPMMIAVHPLSGVQNPSAFDLETGRLCVMASRHQAACIFVTRDHVGGTLATHLPQADQALGRGDTVGKGHAQHRSFWNYHQERNLIV